jgi:PAS domain S-box-containing protein
MDKTEKKTDSKILRQKAEELMKNKQPENYPQFSEANTLKLIHELQVHQVELELQNEELLLAKEKAEQAIDKYTELYDFAPTGYFTLTENSDIIELNLTGAALLGKERSKLQGCNFELFVTKESKSVFNNFIENVFNGTEPTKSCEIKLTVNKELHYDILLKGFANESKNHCFVSATDITQRKQMELELIEEKERAEENDRLKTAFLQNMSHEIRTPMNAIKGFSSLLVTNHNNPAKLQKFSQIIDQRSDDLLNIIDDILDIARIESGQLPVHEEECDLFELFDELTTQFVEFQDRLNKNHIQLRLQVYCNPEGTVIITDRGKLKQILVNLLTNAFKFTNEGKIEGSCKIVNNKLMFYISDTGIGIPKHKQKAVFDRFTQLQHTENRAIGGTGLGLSIVNGLVQLLGGNVMLESEPGQGSEFSFEIPYKLKSAKTRIIEKATAKNTLFDFTNKTILIVEDEIYNEEYLKEILFETGINILSATTGKNAIDIASNHSIDLVLLDFKLPDMDGYQVFHEIRKVKPNLKFIAQTAYAADTDKRKVLDSGVNDYISKPIDSALLLSIISKHLNP